MKLIKADFTHFPLKWKYEETLTPYPPAVVEIDGKDYLLSGFDKAADSFLHAGSTDLNGALELSIALHGEPNPAELGRMIRLGESFGKSFAELSVITARVKGRKNAESLKVLSDASSSFIKYISDKQPSLKTIGMYAALPGTHKSFLHLFADAKAPSVSAFRAAVEILTDYADEVIDPFDLSLTEKLEARRSSLRTGFTDKFGKLTAPLGADVSSRNNFETAELTVSFNASSPQEYMRKSEELYKNRENIAQVYEFLKENDIY